MGMVSPYYDASAEGSVHHVYDDCPAGERVIDDGVAYPGDGGNELCAVCDEKLKTGDF